jgi:cyanophycinase
VDGLRARGTGPLAIVGGRLESDNSAIFAEMGRLSGGRIAVLSMASQSPAEVGAELASDFASHGIAADPIPLYWENRTDSAFDPALLARLEACGSAFFSGGDQSRIVQALVQQGRETPALQAIRRFHARGGLVAGSSAGAAMMSSPMILGGTSLAALARDIDAADPDGFGTGPGLGFFPWGMVDQHFLQRGRIGRLLAAQFETGAEFGFGVDENTALFVEGERARVVGETGVIVVDLREARRDVDSHVLRGARISYLDDGDGWDLAAGRALPAPGKQPLDVSTRSFRDAARVRRHAFAAYTLLDLLLRLVEGDPERYLADHALADDEASGLRVRLEVERDPERSLALRAVREDGEIRYSAIDFVLGLQRHALTSADPEPEQIPLPAVAPCAAARLVLLGSSPVPWPREGLAGLLPELRAPVGVLALASSQPRRIARQYLEWLRGLGIEAELIDVSLANIERAGRDGALLDRIRSMGSLLFTGGDQRLMTDTLLHCGEPTPVLGAILGAAAAGAPLVAVAAAAAAMGERMIVEGDSAAALRLGASEDAGFEGVVVESGLAFARCGLIDQNFLSRHRLGRLLVACAATGTRHGFGLCEEAGMILDTGAGRIRAIGAGGVIVAELDPMRARLSAPRFDPRGIELHLIEPGQDFELAAPARSGPPSAAGRALLERAVRDLARDCNEAAGRREPRVDPARLSEALLERAVA